MKKELTVSKVGFLNSSKNFVGLTQLRDIPS